MSISEDKKSVILDIREKLMGMLRAAHESARDAQAEANSHVGAMQSRYDTFKEEAQYLAEAQKLRAMQLEASVAACNDLIKRLDAGAFELVEIGARVKIHNDAWPKSRVYFVVPGGAGGRVTIGEEDALCVTPEAPVIAPFVGLAEGDYPEFGATSDVEDCYVVEIA